MKPAYNRKLSPDQVRYARECHEKREAIMAEMADYPSQKELARLWNVNQTTIRNAIWYYYEDID